MLGHIRRYEDVIAGLLIVGVALVFVVLIRRRQTPPLLSEQTPTTPQSPSPDI